MKKNVFSQIRSLEEKLDSATPEEVAPIVKKIVKIKDRYIHGK